VSWCDDENECTVDFCEPETGECHYEAIDCNDDDLCTLDWCEPESGCVHFGKDCDDGNADTEDVCVDGACVFLIL